MKPIKCKLPFQVKEQMIPLKNKQIPKFEAIKAYMDQHFDQSKDSIEDMKSLVKWISEVKLVEPADKEVHDVPDADETKPESAGAGAEPSKKKMKVKY